MCRVLNFIVYLHWFKIMLRCDKSACEVSDQLSNSCCSKCELSQITFNNNVTDIFKIKVTSFIALFVALIVFIYLAKEWRRHSFVHQTYHHNRYLHHKSILLGCSYHYHTGTGPVHMVQLPSTHRQ